MLGFDLEGGFDKDRFIYISLDNIDWKKFEFCELYIFIDLNGIDINERQ